jgi:quercetin dioxygenase-like cupin family protein
VCSGRLRVSIAGEIHEVPARHALTIAPNTRHSLSAGLDETFVVFHLGPLAPRPELGHVKTE